MNQKLRKKILEKLAQQATTTPQPAQQQVPPAPAILASTAYPNIRSGYTSAQINIIDSLVSKLNNAAQLATNGSYNLQVLKNNSFIFDPSSFPSPDQKNLLLFFSQVFHRLMNNGNRFEAPVSSQQLSTNVSALLRSQALMNLSQINPTGPVAQKVSPNLQQDIKDDLTRLIPNVAVPRV